MEYLNKNTIIYSFNFRFLCGSLFVLFYTIAPMYSQVESPNTYRFNYKATTFKGSRVKITNKIRSIKNNSLFINIPEIKQKELNGLFRKMRKQPIPKLYKRNAVKFLERLYSYEKFLRLYEQILIEVVESVKKDMKYSDFKFEREFTRAKIKLERSKNESNKMESNLSELAINVEKSKLKLLCHRWMRKKFDTYESVSIIKKPDTLIQEFKKSESLHVFTMIEEDKVPKINPYLEHKIIDFFHNKALPEISNSDLELEYITKI